MREEEQVESAAVVGVDTVVEFLGQPDGILEYGVPLRRAHRRRGAPAPAGHRAHGNFRETWGGAYALNQADHIATGRAVLDAVRDAGNRWIFPEQLTDGIAAVGRGPRGVGGRLAAARHGVDTTDTFDKGVASLRAHGAYLSGLGDGGFDAEEFLEGMARPAGSRLGARFGATFEVFQINLQ